MTTAAIQSSEKSLLEVELGRARREREAVVGSSSKKASNM
jgi:hypothetical protein